MDVNLEHISTFAKKIGVHLSNTLMFDCKRNRACATGWPGSAISLPGSNSAFWLISVKLKVEIEVIDICNKQEIHIFRVYKKERSQTAFPSRMSRERETSVKCLSGIGSLCRN